MEKIYTSIKLKESFPLIKMSFCPGTYYQLKYLILYAFIAVFPNCSVRV